MRTFADRLMGPFRRGGSTEAQAPPPNRLGEPLPPPPETKGLTLVGHGVVDEVTWGLYDGRTSTRDRPDATADWFSLAHVRGSGGGSAGVNPPLAQDVSVAVEWHRLGKGRRGYACLQARCAATVDAAVVVYRDGSTERIEPMVSPATGQRWVVRCFHGSRRARRIDFVDAAGVVLRSEDGSGRKQ